ncbi:hypothetical protein [Aquirufa ecclesiirivi]|uniref:hypothetical protein n=1 Tax=Aquirufa ecclesiirivi TaxID=2715124 RepID=UPI003BAE998D
MKLKTYVLTVSRYFPSTHPRKGEDTGFIDKILTTIMGAPDLRKIHTIRGNYELWEKRIKEVQDGKAILSLRYWEGKPYDSKQVEFARLDKNSGIGIQKLVFLDENFEMPFIFENGYASLNSIFTLAKNDGLSFEDFKAWFKVYDLSQPMAIIHFTSFRY